jgi:hypothetical protein
VGTDIAKTYKCVTKEKTHKPVTLTWFSKRNVFDIMCEQVLLFGSFSNLIDESNLADWWDHHACKILTKHFVCFQQMFSNLYKKAHWIKSEIIQVESSNNKQRI